MEQFTIEKVNAIPSSRWNKRKKGDSKYNELLNSLRDMPVNAPMQIHHPEFKAHRIYNALWLMLKNKRIKNIRIALRKNKVYAEKIFE